MKKLLVLVVCLSLLLTMFAAAALAEGEKEVVNFWYLWAGAEEAALKETIEAYNAQSDKYVVKGSLCDIPKQTAGMASKNGPDVTDIVDNSVANLASKGILMSLDEYAAANPEMMADFLPAALRQCYYQDTLYGLPVNCMASMIYYNKAILADAGIEELPTTLDELEQLVFDLTIVDENGSITQSGWPWTGTIDYMNMVQLNGGKLYNDDMTEVTPDDPVMLRVLEFGQRYVETFGVENIRKFNASLGGWISSQDSFFVGKQALRSDGWYLSRYVEPTGHAEDLDWDVFPYPTDEAHAGVGYISTSIFIIPATTNNKDGAWDFLNFLMAPENMAPLMSSFGNEPARHSASGEPAFADAPAFEKYYALSSKENTVTFPGHAIESEYRQTLAAAIDEVLALKVTPEEAMASVKAKMQPVLDKANG